MNEFAALLRDMHEVAHQPIDTDDPGLLINLPTPQVALLMLGLLLVGRAMPCLEPERIFLLSRINELWDYQTGEFDDLVDDEDEDE